MGVKLHWMYFTFTVWIIPYIYIIYNIYTYIRSDSIKRLDKSEYNRCSVFSVCYEGWRVYTASKEYLQDTTRGLKILLSFQLKIF